VSICQDWYYGLDSFYPMGYNMLDIGNGYELRLKDGSLGLVSKRSSTGPMELSLRKGG